MTTATEEVQAVVAAIRAGRAVILPTDTVYGLCAAPEREPVRLMYALKGRVSHQPTALVAASCDVLLQHVPELRGRSEAIARALLPGPYTLILANPARRFPWLTGSRPETIGVRVPELKGPARHVLDQVGAVGATSANLPGGTDPATLDDLPMKIRAGAGAIVDGGRLPGVPSTVLDVTGEDPQVVREGTGSPAEALAQIAALRS